MLKVFGKNIIITPEENSKEFESEAEITAYKGTVYAIGKDVTSVNVGDNVYFHTFNSQYIKEKNWIAIDESNLIALTEEK